MITYVFRQERIYLPQGLQSIILGCQGRSSRHKPGGGNWSTNHVGRMLWRLFPLTCSHNFLMHPRTTCLKMVPPTVGGALLHQLTVKKCATDMSISQLDGGNFSIAVPSAQIEKQVYQHYYELNNIYYKYPLV